MSQTWTPDLSVSVHDDELIVRFDHLPPEEILQVEAECEEGGVMVHDAGALHCLHVPLPETLDLRTIEARPIKEAFELRVHLPG